MVEMGDSHRHEVYNLCKRFAQEHLGDLEGVAVGRQFVCYTVPIGWGLPLEGHMDEKKENILKEGIASQYWDEYARSLPWERESTETKVYLAGMLMGCSHDDVLQVMREQSAYLGKNFRSMGFFYWKEFFQNRRFDIGNARRLYCCRQELRPDSKSKSVADRRHVQKTIGLTDLQRRLRSILDEVTSEGAEYVLTRSDRPEAALIPYDEFSEFLRWREREVVQAFDQAVARLAEQNAQYSEEEIATDVEAAIQEVRNERA